jgi:hypothetical protein
MKNFPHAFRVMGGFISGTLVVTVGHGTVNGWEPKVGGVRISGMDEKGKMLVNGSPVISGPKEFDAYGRTYVSIQIKIDPVSGKFGVGGEVTEDDLTIVVSKHLKYGNPKNSGLASPVYWNHPIAVFSDSRNFGQIAYFNYLHFTKNLARNSVLGGVDGTSWSHYFCIA